MSEHPTVDSAGQYYIVKQAIYTHGVYGPYPSRRAAIAAFKKAYKNDTSDSFHGDFDGHHDYLIIKGLNEPIGKTLRVGKDFIQYEAKREK